MPAPCWRPPSSITARSASAKPSGTWRQPASPSVWTGWTDASQVSGEVPILNLVDAGAARPRSLVRGHQQEEEQHRRHQEAPGRPKRMIAALDARDNAGNDRTGDGDDAPDGNDLGHDNVLEAAAKSNTATAH